MSDRDELRAKCLEASARRLAIYYGRTDIGWETYVPDAIAALDALHGIARVTPVEITDDMIGAAYRVVKAERDLMEKKVAGNLNRFVHSIYDAMSATGDLTSYLVARATPETKP